MGKKTHSPEDSYAESCLKNSPEIAQALTAVPDKKNEASGLMIMGLFGGTVFPLAMGYAADAIGQIGAVAVMTVGVVYLLYYTLKIKNI